MAWAIWLGAPLVATLLVACLLWWRGRDPRAPTTRSGIRDHRAYLEALDPQGSTVAAHRVPPRGDAGP